VPVKWPIRRTPAVFVADLTQFLLSKKLGNTKTITVRSDFYWKAGDANAVERFVHEAVPESAALLKCRGGVVGSRPTPEPQYVVHYPTIPVSRFRRPILNQIRTTAACSILFMHETRSLGGPNSAMRRKLESVVRQFMDDPHWENFMAIGLSLHADGKYAEALPFYERARAGIRSDKNVAHLPEWKKTVRTISAQIKKAKREESA
jgi:hypothetical protein